MQTEWHFVWKFENSTKSYKLCIWIALPYSIEIHSICELSLSEIGCLLSGTSYAKLYTGKKFTASYSKVIGVLIRNSHVPIFFENLGELKKTTEDLRASAVLTFCCWFLMQRFNWCWCRVINFNSTLFCWQRETAKNLKFRTL